MKSFRIGRTSFPQAGCLVFLLLAVPQAHAQDVSEAYRAGLSYRDAVHGDADAQADLGFRYAQGNGLPQSDDRAVHWLTRAANQGPAAAQLMLAELLSAGRGGANDDAVAYKWAFLAGVHEAQGPDRDRAVALAATLAARMSRGQIAEARRLIDRWRAQPEGREPPAAVQKTAAPNSSSDISEPDAPVSAVHRRDGVSSHDVGSDRRVPKIRHVRSWRRFDRLEGRAERRAHVYFRARRFHLSRWAY